MTKAEKIILLLILSVAIFLRSYNTAINPPGLYWDEASIGYDAYSILKTAHDHHRHFMPLFFESYGDWKLPGYIYLLVPFISIFGLNELSVRFLSVMSGLLTVLVFYLLVKELTANIKLALIAAFFLAISPWHIQFSRAAFEATPALFLFVTGFYLLLVAVKRQKISYLTLGSALLVLSMYTYHAYRIFAPTFMLVLALLFYKKLKKLRSLIVLPTFLAIVLSVPLIIFTLSEQGKLRATSQSAFSFDELRKSRLEYDQKSKKPLRFLSNKVFTEPMYYSQVALKNYLENFSPVYLFVNGDSVGRHSQVDMGQLYFFDLITLGTAIVVVTKLKKQTLKIFAAWLLLSPLPAVIVTPSPHALRSLQAVIPFTFFSALGANYLLTKVRSKVIIVIAVTLFCYSLVSYLNLLFVHYPRKFGPDWQEGYKNMVNFVVKVQDNYPKIYITSAYGMPHMYTLFYTKYNPQSYIDQKGSENGFDKYSFVTDQTDIYDKGRILYVSPSWQKVDGTKLTDIFNLNGDIVFSIWEVNGRN